MKLWEAVIYAVLGGITEVLPTSFFGHALVVQNALNLTPLWSAQGYWIRAAICLGTALGSYAAFRGELSRTVRELRRMRRPGRRAQSSALQRRSIAMGLVALAPMLLSLFFLGAAESLRRLPVVAVLFALNGLLVRFATQEVQGHRTEQEMLLPDALRIGMSRAASILPGLSSVGTSLCVGHGCGLAPEYNLRFSYALSITWGVLCAVYYLVRGVIAGGLAPILLCLMLVALALSAAVSYLSIQYLRYLLHKGKLSFFSFYNWDAAAAILVLALINS